jgi:nucleotide-binding universal stress UspA family protein
LLRAALPLFSRYIARFASSYTSRGGRPFRVRDVRPTAKRARRSHYLRNGSAELERGQWEKVVEAAWPRLVRALTGLAGEAGRAEDALQDAVEAALKPGVIEKIERADAWLYAVAVRRLGRTRLRARLESALSDVVRGNAPPRHHDGP